jgi:hypothetical protein
MKEEYRDLQKKKWQEAAHKLAENENLQSFFKEILYNFAHRYMANDTSPGPQLSEPEQSTVRITSIEKDMKSALKTNSQKARDGVIELIQKVGLKNSPAVMYSIDLKSNMTSQGQIEVWVECAINWDFPNFSFDAKKIDLNKTQKKYSDFIELRNDLARVLESTCEIF